MKISSISVQVPAGTYWLGDPCYVFDDEQWDDLIDNNFDSPIHILFDKDPDNFTLNQHQILMFRTSHGDGVYVDAGVGEYPVDSGTIGLVPIALVPNHEDFEKVQKLGGVVTFDKDVNCGVDYWDDYMVFGHIRINLS